jgi:pimeloyl-ACP methyl ester carboxylesterase
MENPKIAKLYRDVPEEPLKRLQTFRQQYPYQSLTIHDHEWRFIDTREGEQTLVVMAGATTIAEISYQSLAHFAQSYRVIAPDYPRIGNLTELFEGLTALLDHLEIDNFYLMGGSYGGWMAQSLVRAYPERVRKLVLTAIGPPNPENSQKIKKLLRWLRWMPSFVLSAMISRSFSKLDASKAEEYPDMSLMWAMVKEVMNYRVKREDIFTLMYLLIDQTENYIFTPDDLRDWRGGILVVCGSEDPSTPLETREAMQTLYPQAQVKVFEGGEHGIALTHQDEYFAVIDEFLES